MLIVRAPMRLSFAGGGTDLPAYSDHHEGMVVSSAIDKYVYAFVAPNGSPSLQISSSDYSTFFRHAEEDELGEEGKLRYARVFLRHFRIRSGYSLFMASEMPPGTGLGSSSSLSVALVKALSAAQGNILAKDEVAALAARIEITQLRMPIGRQDHYASAFGGVNVIRFSRGKVTVEPLKLSPRTRRWMADSLMMFFTEQSHDSAEILAEQGRRSREERPATMEALHAIRAHADELRDALLDDRPEELGGILHRTWMKKRDLAPGISNPRIDSAYEEALGAGALGGKIAGAGGGGFLLLACPPTSQKAVTALMHKHRFLRSDFRFDSVGARILVNNAAS